jgi:hypothetical protein
MAPPPRPSQEMAALVLRQQLTEHLQLELVEAQVVVQERRLAQDLA